MSQRRYGDPKKFSVWPSDYGPLQSTADCVKAYAQDRLMGAIPNREATEALVASAYCLDADRVLHESGMADSAKGKLTKTIDCLRQLDPELFTERQTDGDCVSHGTRNGGDVTRACDIVAFGQPEAFVARGATEPFYGARGGSFVGANCSVLVRWASQEGGCLVRKDYPELGVNLSKYDSSIGDRWGARGVPEPVRAEAAKHPFRYMARVTTWEQYRDFAGNGYGLLWCAGISYSEQRDANGVARLTREGWSHSQANGFIFDDSPWAYENYREPVFGIAQSWGIGFASGGWNTERYGPAHGSVSLLPVSVLNLVLRTGDVWALGDFDGFKKKIDKLPDSGAGSYL